MLHTVNCSAPSAASGVVTEPYSSTTVGVVIHYNCDELQWSLLISVFKQWAVDTRS